MFHGLDSMATVLLQDQGQGAWQTAQLTLHDLCTQREQKRGRFIVFLPPVTDNSRDKLQKAFSIIPSTWDEHYEKSTGYFSALETQDNPPTYSTAFRFLVKMTSSDKSRQLTHTIHHDWVELGFWTEWRPDHSSVLLCRIKEADNHCRTFVQRDFVGLLRKPDVDVFSFPFAWHALILENIVVPLFDTSVWECRHLIRDREKSRPNIKDQQEDYKVLYDIARHAFHSTETLQMSMEVVRNMLKELGIFWEDHKPPERSFRITPAEALLKPRLVDFRAATRALDCQLTLLSSFHGRSQAIENRVREEISLAFHVSTQRDSNIAAQIAESSLADSAATKTISVLGMIFLPGTLISGIFGMNFFSFTPPEEVPGSWAVSSKFWVYWATTLPITLIVVSVWMMCQPGVAKKRAKLGNGLSSGETPSRLPK